MNKTKLQEAARLSTSDTLEFLENFKKLSLGVSDKSKLISIKVPESLLAAFKMKAKSEGVLYQSKIKQLMAQWLSK